MLLRFSTRRLLRHWRLNLAVLLGLGLASGLLAGLPSFAVTIAANSLRYSLAETGPSGRNIEIGGLGFSLSGGLYKFISDELGDLLVKRMVVRNITMDVDPEIALIPSDENDRLVPQFITAWSFDKMRDTMRLLEGQWPEFYEPQTQQEIQRMMFHVEIEAAIDVETASQLHLKIGDRLITNSTVEYLIVGIVKRLDPKDDIWWGDPTPFEPVFRPGINEDTIFVPVIVAQRSMGEYLDGHTIAWRLSLDQGYISAENAEEIEQRLIRLKTHVQSSRANMESNLPNLLSEYRQNLAMARMMLFLLSVQAFLFILYTLALVTSLLLERSKGEMAILAGRGASRIQITHIFATEGLLLTLLAGGLLGPGLALLGLRIWALFSGEPVPPGLPPEAWLFSLIGAALGWLALMSAIYPAARRSVLEWQRRLGRPAKFAAWQHGYLDIFLFLLGCMAYWQLRDSGSFVSYRMRDTALADPLLLLGPSLFLIALAILTLRILPYLLQLGSRLARSGRGLVLPLGFARLARDPVRPNQVVLLMSLAAGLTFFATAFINSLDQSQLEVARYRTGTDMRVKQLNHTPDDFTTIPGVLNVTSVFRGVVQDMSGKSTTLLVVDPLDFGEVSAPYPLGMTNLTIETVMSGLQWYGVQQEGTTQENMETNPYLDNPAKDTKPIPAIFSRQALGVNRELGEEQVFRLAPHQVNFQVRGTVVNFPTVSGSFILVNRSAISDIIDLEDSRFYHNHEVWLRVNPVYHENLINHPIFENKILADAQRELQAMQHNAFVQGTGRAFQLNAAILVVLSVISFFLVSVFAARYRVYEFSILRATGFSAVKVFGLLAGESILIMTLGLLSGTGIGVILVQVMRPYLNHVMARLLPGMVIYRIAIDWSSIGSLYGILIGFYILAMLAALGALLRTGIHRVMRIGEE